MVLLYSLLQAHRQISILPSMHQDYFYRRIIPNYMFLCYINGDPANANVAAGDAFVGVNFDATGTTDHVATAGEIGSTGGVAYSKQSKKIIHRCFPEKARRFRPLGSGGIYLIDPSTGCNQLAR